MFKKNIYDTLFSKFGEVSVIDKIAAYELLFDDNCDENEMFSDSFDLDIDNLKEDNLDYDYINELDDDFDDDDSDDYDDFDDDIYWYLQISAYM